MAARVTLGGGKLVLADVSAIAVLRAPVHVELPEPTAASAAAAAVEAPVAAKQEQSSPPDAVHRQPIARAVLVLQLHTLTRMRLSNAVRDNVRFISQLLNHDIVPLVPAGPEEHSATVLLAATRGAGFARHADTIVPLSEALVSAQIALPTPLTAEDQRLLAGQTPATLLAVATLTVGGAQGLLSSSDAVAALTCEFLHAQSAPFEAEYVDASRPHRGIVTSASNLRLMLENSKYINAKPESESVAAASGADCIRAIPQYHGPARDAVLAAAKTVELELNSALTGNHAVHPQALRTTLASTVDALKVLLAGSNQRRAVLAAASQTTSGSALEPSSPCAVELVETVAKSLTQELQVSLAFFDKEDDVLKSRLAEKQAKAQEAAAKAAAAAAKEDEKLAAMPEAQRNKILEKRKKKMEKTKEKDSAGKKKSEEIKIGVGSAALRQFVTAQGGVSVLQPFELRATGLARFLEDLYVQLGSGGTRRKPKIAKGAQDFLPAQMALREKIFNKIRMVFKRHAGVEIETPVFELKDTLTGKYGEDSKLIYDLADQGGELLALRYDLTVPFARFMAMHNPGNIKRFHLARVYRRDNPQMARGRFREFYQCDFDIAGSYAPMLPDAEVLSIGIEVLQQFPELGPVKVKLSHRRLLDAILAICGVPADKFRTTCSAIDKLDKEPWSEVRREMVEDKGLPEAVADAIEPFVCQVGSPRELHAQLLKDQLFGTNADAQQALQELALLFDYLEAMGVLQYISFDLSLARGLDYYTGLIYEFVLTSPEHNVGSIAAGGRYDNLVGMFSATGQQIPCVGVSMGIERIFGILQAHAEASSRLATPVAQVLVASTGGSLLLPRLELCQQLWRANIAAEVLQVENPKFTKQLHYALESGIAYMVVIGEDELAHGQVKIKHMASKDEVTVARDEMVAELLRRGCATTSTLSI